MRKLAISLVVVCVVIVLVLAIVPQFLNVDQYRGRIQSELQTHLGRPVTLGEIKASLLPPKLQVKDLVIGEDPQFGAGPFAKAQELDVRVALLPLLRKEVQIKALELRNPDIELVRNEAGIWNYASLGKASSSSTKPGEGTQLILDHLQIVDGRLRYIDQKSKVQSIYDNIDVTLNNFAPGKVFGLDATVHIAGKSNQQIQVKGNAGPIATGSAMVPFNGSVELKDISIGDLQKVANIGALEGYNGVASGSLKARTDRGVLHSEGTLKIDDPQIKATKLGYPITLDFNLDDDLNRDVLNIENGTLHLGPTPLTIKGTINSSVTPAQIDMHLSTQGASIAEAARLAAAAGVAFNAGTNIRGTVNADVTARGATTNPALSGNFKATGVEITGGEIKQPVNVPQLELTMTPGAISSNQFTAKTGSTQLNGKFSLTDYTTQQPSIEATLLTSNANVGELLAMANAYGISAVEGMSGSGQITLNLTASGLIKNSTAMVYSGSGKLENATLRTAALTKPLSVRNADIRFSQNSMMLDNLAAGLDQTNANGNVSIRNFAAPQIQFALSLDTLDLAAMQNIVATPATPAKRAGLSLLPRAEAATTTEPSLLTKATGSGNISVGVITYDQLALNNVKSAVTLDRGVIRLAPLTSTIYGGQQSGEIVLDTRQTPAAVTVSTKLQKVDANKLVSSMTSIKETLYGLLAANTNATFRAASGNGLTQSLNGKLALDLSNGRIAKIDLLNQLATIGRFLNASSSNAQQPFTDVTRLTGTFDVVNGVANTHDLRAVIPGANLAANGTINLVTNALNLKLSTVLSKDFSQKVGGNGVGGFMQTALANNNGELVMPVLVTGTFDNPRFAPDVQEIARMKLQNLVPSFGNPGGLTSGILGSVLGGKKGQQQNGLGGVLDAFSGKKTAAGNQQQNQQQTQPANQNPLGDLLNQVLQGKKKKQPAQQPPPDSPK